MSELTQPPSAHAAWAPADPRRASRWQRDYALVARAVDHLDTVGAPAPSIAALATDLHVSAGHLHRTFARFAGTSPARFARWLTAGAARELLRSRHAVLDTALEVGLSSSGRLHDLCVTVDAMTPGEIGAQGEGLEIGVGVHPTPLGPVRVLTTPRGVLELVFVTAADGAAVGGPAMGPESTAAPAAVDRDGDWDGDGAGDGGRNRDGDGAGDEVVDAWGTLESAALTATQAAWPRAAVSIDRAAGTAAVAHLGAVLDGVPVGDPMPVAAIGTNLQLAVWEALLRIPDDQVATYTDLARLIDRPAAVRAVANAVGRNPVAALIPCHRVLRSTGGLGGYRWGSTRKRILLAREAARADAGNAQLVDG